MTQPVSPPMRTSRWAAAFAGLVAVATALATGELLAGLVPGVPSPILAVGRVVIDLQPPGAKELVVSIFGTADKLALEVLVLAVALVIGAGLGILARGRPGIAAAVVGGFVVIGVGAGLQAPDTQPALAVLGGVAEFAAGTTALDRLMRVVATSPGPASPGGTAIAPDWSRRMLLVDRKSVV